MSDARAAGIPHLNADGDWGEETASLGLRRMAVMSNGHTEGAGSVPRSSTIARLPVIGPILCEKQWQEQK